MQQYPEWIWHNGAIKPWAQATTHVMSHALHYGSSVFEGIRSYETPDGPAIFRLGDHTRRLFASARIYEMDIPYTPAEIDWKMRSGGTFAAGGFQQRDGSTSYCLARTAAPDPATK